MFSIDLNPIAGVNWQKQMLNYPLASISDAQNPSYNSFQVAKQGRRSLCPVCPCKCLWCNACPRHGDQAQRGWENPPGGEGLFSK